MNKISYIFFALTLSICCCISIPAQAADAKTERELIKIQNEWAAARVKRDVPYLENLYAKEFRITNMSGGITERADDISAFASGDLKPESVINEEMKVSQYGKVAIVTGIEKVKGTYKNIPGDFVLRFTNVFVRRDGRWQLVTHHSTPVSKK